MRRLLNAAAVELLVLVGFVAVLGLMVKFL
jgi:hypothetical protein